MILYLIWVLFSRSRTTVWLPLVAVVGFLCFFIHNVRPVGDNEFRNGMYNVRVDSFFFFFFSYSPPPHRRRRSSSPTPPAPDLYVVIITSLFNNACGGSSSSRNCSSCSVVRLAWVYDDTPWKSGGGYYQLPLLPSYSAGGRGVEVFLRSWFSLPLHVIQHRSVA